MPDAMADRRINTRYPMILVAIVTQIRGDMKLRARTSDLSRTGCYVDTLHPLPKGSSVLVKLSHEHETLEVRGSVMYVSQGLGMGIEFEAPLPPKQAAILNQWLQSAANREG